MKLNKIFLVNILLLCSTFSVLCQDLKFERERHKQMLKMVTEDVRNNYFDPAFKGIDLEAKYAAAVDKLKIASSVGQMSGVIAQFLVDFDDSHLFFIPPGKRNKSEYGFKFRMFGDTCLVFQIDKEGDAGKRGLAVGDQIYALQGYGPTRENLWKMSYMFFSLRPLPELTLTIVKPDGKQTEFAVPAKIHVGRPVTDLTESSAINQYIRDSDDAYYRETVQYYFDKLDGVFIWKMPRFSVDPPKVDAMIGRAKNAPAMILDLRGNGGGRVDMLLRLIGNVFPLPIKVGDEKKRKEMKEVTAKSRGKDAFSGKLIVLIDSGSGSASEVFSRVIQIEKRGTIIGDRSAGAVMESRVFGHQVGLDVVVPFGSSITVADLIMKDGKSLEKIGVTPDILVIPTGKDLAAKRDIVMAKALEILGITVTPEAAGAFFPEETPN